MKKKTFKIIYRKPGRRNVIANIQALTIETAKRTARRTWGMDIEITAISEVSE